MGSSKKILVLNDNNEVSSYLAKRSTLKSTFTNVGKSSNAVIKTVYSAESDFNHNAVFQLELISSKIKINPKGDFFRNVPKTYDIEEVYNSETGMYSYIVDEQMNLMSTYIAYKQLVKAGFKSVITKTEILTDPAEKDIYSIKKIFGTSTDVCFDSYNRLTSSAVLMLDQIIKTLNKYPEIRLEIDIHTDNTGSADEKLALSKKYAQIIANYLIDKGMSSGRLIPKGFGGSRPVTSNNLEEERSSNRRIDFKIVRQ
jgi:outer membrane protein OmpA-like peptidoglycan-associated protein